MARKKSVKLSDESLMKELKKAEKMSEKSLHHKVKAVQDKVKEKHELGKKFVKVDIPIEVLLHFCKAGFSQAAMATNLGVSKDTIHNAFERHGLDWGRLKAFKDNKSEVLALKQMQLLDKMTVDKMEAASLRDQATTLNILNNTEKIERGQATKIMDVRVMTNQLAELDAEEQRLRAMLDMAEDVEPIQEDEE